MSINPVELEAVITETQEQITGTATTSPESQLPYRFTETADPVIPGRNVSGLAVTIYRAGENPSCRPDWTVSDILSF
jgi:hypothetical protein